MDAYTVHPQSQPWPPTIQSYEMCKIGRNGMHDQVQVCTPLLGSVNFHAVSYSVTRRVAGKKGQNSINSVDGELAHCHVHHSAYWLNIGQLGFRVNMDPLQHIASAISALPNTQFYRRKTKKLAQQKCRTKQLSIWRSAGHRGIWRLTEGHSPITSHSGVHCPQKLPFLGGKKRITVLVPPSS